ncbi:class II fructose-bisphosphate aldolase [Geodermatophilus sp. DSM 44513]|uniref:class II fructose-bisphosphate aldolase n=1 Tax=Geodermatophilus sp. DSM 44513 TaxID=1528104 RepID=UPI00127FB810|nr:class II fructose-bisphosphate aldolase [Geodermatophilus sp. DSM 44513]WNV73866.1 class II fructose-bisphosphate aldolase [Geodermatophilus sp. DSM 44513]
MARAALTDVLTAAQQAHGGVGAFNVVQLEHAEAIVAGAERAGRPTVLQVSENAVRYHGALTPVGRAMLEIADAADVPVVVHLDHATDVALVEQALALGFTSVMFDGSTLPVEENLATTRGVVEQAHDRGASVEAEIGEIGGKDGVHAPGVRTRPEDAARFVAETGIDAVAVAVGSSHAMTTRTARLDLDLVRAIRDAVPVPLVLHGSSGVPDDHLRQAVQAGMTKINISTHLNGTFTRAVREQLLADPALVDPRTYLGAARTATALEVERLVRLLAG